jgi:hypothetical protein
MWAVQKDISDSDFKQYPKVHHVSTSALSAICLYLQVHVLQICSRDGIYSRTAAGGVMEYTKDMCMRGYPISFERRCGQNDECAQEWWWWCHHFRNLWDADGCKGKKENT